MTDPDRRAADRGLQPERTALAWRRTGLALTAGAAIGMRTLPGVLGRWSILAASALFVLAVVVVVISHIRRHERGFAGTGPLPGGALATVVAGVAALTGVLALVFTIAR